MNNLIEETNIAELKSRFDALTKWLYNYPFYEDNVFWKKMANERAILSVRINNYYNNNNRV